MKLQDPAHLVRLSAEPWPKVFSWVSVGWFSRWPILSRNALIFLEGDFIWVLFWGVFTGTLFFMYVYGVLEF